MSAITERAMNRRILRRNAAIKKIGIGKTAFYEIRNNDPTFPSAVILSERARGYFEDEIDTWLDARPRVVSTQPD